MSTMHKVSGGYVEYDYQTGRTRSIQVYGGDRDDGGGYGSIKPNNREK